MLLYIWPDRNVILYGGLQGQHGLELVYYQRSNLKLVLFMRKALPSSLLDCFSDSFKSHYCLSQHRTASHLPTEIVNKQIFLGQIQRSDLYWNSFLFLCLFSPFDSTTSPICRQLLGTVLSLSEGNWFELHSSALSHLYTRTCTHAHKHTFRHQGHWFF